MAKHDEPGKRTGLEIAVIGMAGRFPGSRTIEEFWSNLKNGVESISFFSEKELEKAGIERSILENSNYVKARGILENPDYFDASFFGYSPREAEIMDPQVRIFHECAWEAVEDAGYNLESYKGTIGLYAGASPNLLWEGFTLVSGKFAEMGDFAARQLIDKDFLTTRISFKLNLRGPSITIYTACSTSLVTIHQAGRALLSGECKMALAGGVSLRVANKSGYLYQEGMVVSPDGHCRAFDSAANGTVNGNGVGIVLLKRLKEAEADRDNIHAVIKGSSINNDGDMKAGFTAPGIAGQAEVIKTALLIARIEPGSIGYIETHGTGTNLGDPIEIESLKTVFKTNKKRSCAIGSVKTNIGHLDTTAGVAGFIKTVLVLKRKQLPPTLHFENSNKKIDFENSPFYVNRTLKEWKRNAYPLRACVNSFGIGGTNAHVVLEEWPAAQIIQESSPGGTKGLAPLPVGPGSAPKSREYRLILLSAKTPTALEQMTQNLAGYLKRNPGINLADAAYTLQTGRKAFSCRRMVVGKSSKEVFDMLESAALNRLEAAGLVNTFQTPTGDPFVIFMFPGQGAQYVNMGRDLYREEPLFRKEMDRCFEILKPLMGYDIKEILYPGEMDNRSYRSNRSYIPDINQTGIAQPLLFVFEYALAKLLMKWGIKPDGMIGHSIGEYVAACLSGIFSLEGALKLVTLRGKLMQGLPRGSMLGVPLPEEELTPLLGEELSLAAVNSTSHCVVSGCHETVEAFAKRLKDRGIGSRRLHTSHAFHSKMMEPVLKKFEQAMNDLHIKLKPAGIPFISNVTGHWITDEEVVNPHYWAEQLRKTVRFADGLTQLLKIEGRVFVEVGPGQVLSTFTRQYHQPGEKAAQPAPVTNLVPHPREGVSDTGYLLRKLGELWLYGVKIHWPGYYREEKRSRISLPVYPFQGQYFAMGMKLDDPDVNNLSRQMLSMGNSTPQSRLYIPSWERSLLTPRDNDQRIMGKGLPGLVFLDESGIGSRLVERLEQDGNDIVTVTMGTEFEKTVAKQYSVNPRKKGDYETLFNELNRLGIHPKRIVHLWGIDKNEQRDTDIREVLDLGFYSILYLAQAIIKMEGDGAVEIDIVTNDMQEVTGEENLCPGKAAVIGPTLVIPQEHPRFFCRSLDITLPGPGSIREKRVLEQLHTEISSGSADRIIAFRGNQRLVRAFKPIPRGEIQEDVLPLREEGIYLITGGLGKIALIIAGYLARRFRARLILTGRSVFPARDQWKHWLTNHDEKDSISVKIRKIQQWEAFGARVIVFSADAADPEQMKKGIAAAEEQLGKINGVIHAAGLIKDDTFQVMEKLEKTHCEQQFQAKVYGLITLENLLQDKELDFCLLMSSVSTVLGGLQFTAYAAANAFMDAFVNKHNQLNKNNWLSVDWDGMPEEETRSGFKRTMALSLQSLNQVVVSNGGNLQERIDNWVKLESFREQGDHKREDMNSFSPRPDLLNPYVPPQNQIEREIAGILQKLFGFEQIGVQDDFFELGGDSLKAVTVIARIHRALNVEIPLAEFFNHPTIEKVAGYINGISGEPGDRFTSIGVVEKKEYYPLCSAQKRLYFLQQLDPGSTGYHILLVAGLEGSLHPGKLEKVFRKLIKRHESLRTSFLKVGEKPFQKIHENVRFSIEYDDTYQLSSDQRVEKAIEDFLRPFDLSQVPLMRVGLLKTGERTHILLFDMHHIITDGVSVTLLTQEFMALYGEKNLPPLKLQYKDYSGWRDRPGQKELMKQQESYWLNLFSGQLPTLNLPTDYPRSDRYNHEGDIIFFTLKEKLGRGLKELAEKEKTTMFTILLTIICILFAKICRQRDLVIGTPVAGRRHVDVQHVIGFFVNTLALRNFPKADKTFTGFLYEVRERTIQAFDNQDYPFEELINQLKVERSVGRNPVFDVIFAFQNIEVLPGHVPGIEISDLILKPYNHKRKTSPFDLAIWAYETGDTLAFSFLYRTGLFKKDTINRLIKYLEDIITSVLENQHTSIGDIKIASHLLDQKLETPQIDFTF